MKKFLGTFFLFSLIGIASAFAATQPEAKQIQLSPLFPPALKVHPHYIDQWSAPCIFTKTANSQHVTSTNWSGYAAMNSLTDPKMNSVSAVSGKWTIPTLHKSSSKQTYSAIWVGIDGYSNNVVEQLGTMQYLAEGKQHNYAWIEMYPARPYEINSFPVHVGDVIFASLVNDHLSNNFKFTLKNKTREKKVTLSTGQPDAKNQSAEWIVEAPSSDSAVLPLAKFSKITMSHCSATIRGVKGPIQAHGRKNASITMQTAESIVKSAPSRLRSEGSKFSVTWKHE